MGRRVDDFRILSNKRLTDDLYILELEGNEYISEFRPGQFVQVRIDGCQETFLRRPISIHDADPVSGSFRLLLQEAGAGTRKLAGLNAGDSINLVYPLGNSFSDPLPGQRVLLVGGGVGIAPLLFMGKRIAEKGFRPDWLLGFRNSNRVIDLTEYRELGEVYLTTEDGSAGEKGYVTNHTILNNKEYDIVYCCGPDAMMKAVAGHCKKRGINCEVSLENLMACGIGICLCCIADTVRGNVCTCTEGPVFNIKDLKW
jgi:dihydroorotate dehydrogenase electron transfer subunit